MDRLQTNNTLSEVGTWQPKGHFRQLFPVSGQATTSISLPESITHRNAATIYSDHTAA